MGRHGHELGQAQDTDSCRGNDCARDFDGTGVVGGRRLWRRGAATGGMVALLQADAELWRDFEEVLRVNPVSLQSIHI